MSGFMFDIVNTIWPGLDYKAMSLAQQSDPDVQAYRTAITSLHLEDVPFSNGSFTLLCDVYRYAESSCTRKLEKIGFRYSTFHITS